MCVCVCVCFFFFFGTLSSTKLGDNHLSIFGTTNGYVFHTLPLSWFHASYMHTFPYNAHTHNLWHVYLMPWLYHTLMFSIFICQKKKKNSNCSLNFSFYGLICNFFFFLVTNFLLIKFVAICFHLALCYFMISAYRYLLSKSQQWKEAAAKGKNQSLTSQVSPLSQRKLDLQLEFSMTPKSDPIPYFKRIQATSKVPPW